MRKYRCRACGQISEGFDYKQALTVHRKHFDETHGAIAHAFGFDRLPLRVEQ